MEQKKISCFLCLTLFITQVVLGAARSDEVVVNEMLNLRTFTDYKKRFDQEKKNFDNLYQEHLKKKIDELNGENLDNITEKDLAGLYTLVDNFKSFIENEFIKRTNDISYTSTEVRNTINKIKDEIRALVTKIDEDVKKIKNNFTEVVWRKMFVTNKQDLEAGIQSLKRNSEELYQKCQGLITIVLTDLDRSIAAQASHDDKGQSGDQSAVSSAKSGTDSSVTQAHSSTGLDDVERLRRYTDTDFIKNPSLKDTVKTMLSGFWFISVLENLAKNAQSSYVRNLAKELAALQTLESKGAKSSAKQALAGRNFKKYSEIMREKRERLGAASSEAISSAYKDLSEQQSQEQSLQKLDIPRLLALGNSLVSDLNMRADEMRALSPSDRARLATEVFTDSTALELASLQLALVPKRPYLVSPAVANSLVLFASLDKNPSGTRTIRDIFMGATRSQDALRNMLHLEAATIFSKVLKQLFINPENKALFYTVTGRSLLLSDVNALSTQDLVSLGRTPLSQVVELLPPSAADSVLENAVAVVTLFEQRDYQGMQKNADRLLSQVRSAVQFKTGDFNETDVLANADVLHKTNTSLISFSVGKILVALDELDMNSVDMARADFDEKLDLYRAAKPDAVAVLLNRYKIIKLIVSMHNARLDLLGLLNDNFDTLQPESKQLALEAGIAALQIERSLTSANLLGGIISQSPEALPVRIGESNVPGALVARSAEVSSTSVGRLSPEDTLGVAVLALKDIALQNTILNIKNNVPSDDSSQGLTSAVGQKREDLSQAVHVLEEEQRRVVRQIKNVVEQGSAGMNTQEQRKIQGQDDAQSQKQNISAAAKNVPQEAKKPLTKPFMDEVAKNAASWFNKLSNKTGMIRLDDVAKVVADKKYDEAQVLYINGFLQTMVL